MLLPRACVGTQAGPGNEQKNMLQSFQSTSMFFVCLFNLRYTFVLREWALGLLISGLQS